MRLVALAEIDRERLARIVETEMYLCLLEVNSTCLETLGAHCLRKFVKGVYFIIVQPLTLLYYLLNLFVTETVVAVYYCTGNLELLYLDLFVHYEYNRIGQLVLMRAQ